MLILHKLQNLSSFVFLHCLIYKVHAAVPLGDSLFILPHAVRFVKNFFQLFSEVSFVLAAPRERFANIPPETTDVNNFFHIFANYYILYYFIMKKSYYFLAGMALLGLMTGCSNELDEPGANPNGDAVRIMFEAPEALQVTRAVTGTNSAQGGLTNVDWSKYDLRYQVAVYSEDGATLLVAPQTQVVDTYGPVSFEFRLTPNNTYKFVAWADFVKQGETSDLHYNTSDFTDISIKDGLDAQLNDESRDAYFLSLIHISEPTRPY